MIHIELHTGFASKQSIHHEKCKKKSDYYCVHCQILFVYLKLSH